MSLTVFSILPITPRCGSAVTLPILSNQWGNSEGMEPRRSLPIVTILRRLAIIAALGAARREEFDALAKIAAYSTDKENDQYSRSAKDAKQAGFSWKEFAVISNIMSFVMPTMKTLRSGVVLGVLVTASVVRAQPANALAEPVMPPALGKEELKMPPPLDSKEDKLTTPATLPTSLGMPLQRPIIFDPMVRQASGCCGQSTHHGGRGIGQYGGCGAGGCASNLCNGRPPCCYTDSDSLFGRLIGGLCEEICCVDPCYEPRWVPEGNAAFFQDGVRPVTTTRIRWDRGFNFNFPDTAEYFWGKINTKGPAGLAAQRVPNNMRWDDLMFYQEIGTPGGGASTFVETPYRSIQTDNNPGASGFTDMNVGFKSVLLDRELLLLSMQFKTFIPIGLARNGLGVGHVSLEPSLLAHLKLTPSTYLQTQLAYWIPLGGTGGFMGSVFHYHASVNHNLCNFACVKVIGTLEMNGWSYRGQFTDVDGVARGLNGSNFLSAGPGIRFQICDVADIGVGTAFGFGNRHGPEELYRTELRLRY